LVMTAIASAGLLGCGTSLNAGGERVRVVTHAESVTACRRLGAVVGDSQFGGLLMQDVGRRSAQAEMRNKAAEMGADALLIEVDNVGFTGAHLIGDGYVCARNASSLDSAPAGTATLVAPAKMLVLELNPIGEVPPRVTKLITEVLLARLAEVSNLSTLGAADIEAMLGVEKQKDSLACSNVACMADLGGALGTDLVLYGGIGNLGSSYSVNLAVIDSARSAVRARVSATVPQHEDDLVPAIPRLVSDLVSRLNGPSSPEPSASAAQPAR